MNVSQSNTACAPAVTASHRAPRPKNALGVEVKRDVHVAQLAEALKDLAQVPVAAVGGGVLQRVARGRERRGGGGRRTRQRAGARRHSTSTPTHKRTCPAGRTVRAGGSTTRFRRHAPRRRVGCLVDACALTSWTAQCCARAATRARGETSWRAVGGAGDSLVREQRWRRGPHRKIRRCAQRTRHTHTHTRSHHSALAGRALLQGVRPSHSAADAGGGAGASARAARTRGPSGRHLPGVCEGPIPRRARLLLGDRLAVELHCRVGETLWVAAAEAGARRGERASRHGE